MTDKQLLLVETGLAVVSDFAKVNGIKMPKIDIIDKPKRANYCGVYATEKEAIKKAKKLMNGHDENWKDCFKIVEK